MCDDNIVMDNSVSQSEELLALQSIYEEKDLIVEHEDPPSGRFAVSVRLPRPFYVTRRKLPCDTESEFLEFEVDYLPPINILFQFPPSYPSQSCPAFLLTCNWLTRCQLSKLCQRLESIWVESSGQVILYSWIQFLQEEALEFLNIINTLDVTELSRFNILCRKVNSVSKHEIVKPISKQNYKLKIGLQSCSGTNVTKISDCKFNVIENVPSVKSGNEIQVSEKPTIEFNPSCDKIFYEGESEAESESFFRDIKPSVTGGMGSLDCRAVLEITNGAMLLSILKEYDRTKRQEAFENMWFTCQVCYVNKKGLEFVQFNKCNHKFCQDCLKSYFEVQIKDGNVHSLNCPEEDCSSQADGTLVKRLVSDDLFLKYDNLLLSRTLEGMSDVAYCPRKACQTPLLIDSESKMGCCPRCSFAFCIFCRMAYHGIAPCNLRVEEKKQICKKYLDGRGSEKAEMERRYGKQQLKLLVENLLSEEWVDSNSKECPHCRSKIEKNDGCNKMTCYRCGVYFCWLCMTRLKSSNPYSHFSDATSTCYNQLFPEDFEFVMPGEYLEL